MNYTTANRFGNKWSVNETLTLQREFELLKMSIDDIATKHQRTVKSITYKIYSEGFYQDQSQDQDQSQEYEM
jgi:hypothetical protein